MLAAVRQRRNRRRNAVSGIDLAPLIDMMFILLIFFMVTTTFVTDLGIEVERPRASTAANVDAKSLRVSITASGQIWVEGRQIEVDGVRGEVREHIRGSGSTSVIVVPDARTSSEELVAVLDAARLGGARKLALATRPRNEVRAGGDRR
jgi:biopolymer transport protein ExbD